MFIRLIIILIWKILDPLFYQFSRLHYINDQSVFRVRITKYKGEKFVLSDGTIISKNDFLLKIHLHNVQLLSEFLKIKNELSRARKIYTRVLKSMPLLASYLMEHPEEEKIKGIIGITTINKGVISLGFECFSPSSKWYRFFKKLGQLPIMLLSNSSSKSNTLTYLFLSKDILYEKYGKKPASH
ncbi:hypothetical protein PH210_21105 [Paenibacillus sp. BSR1-1]|uniref:YkoP family protein n=1 Tax=Paenibacillus sp. BSR1-1 TaxID=3020845 RepID=UPI0025B2686F|nr:hypothetical protein [Paenibacillus sp. BSR1-1]MDN3018689.1 hypothetical protein [Paenibacillus sp. BSR1-1]